MRPSATRPSVLPCSSMPRIALVGSLPARAASIHIGICLASASMSSSADSATVTELPGELATTMPRSVAAATSTFSTPTPGVTMPRKCGGQIERGPPDVVAPGHQHVGVGQLAGQVGAVLGLGHAHLALRHQPRHLPLERARPVVASAIENDDRTSHLAMYLPGVLAVLAPPTSDLRRRTHASRSIERRRRLCRCRRWRPDWRDAARVARRAQV